MADQRAPPDTKIVQAAGESEFGSTVFGGSGMLAVMNRVRIFLVALIVACGAAAAENSNRLVVVHLSGSAYERGLAHGRQLRPQIRELVKLWKRDIGETLSPDPDKFV